MTAYVALLRAVNLMAGTSLAMADLKRICEEAGYRRVKTFIASGNVVFESSAKEAAVKAELEKRLKSHAGKPIDVVVRTAGEMTAILKDFPFKTIAKNHGVVIFLDARPPADALQVIAGQAKDEKVALGKREIYVAYGEKGIGRSKLKIPAAKEGTARNLNTVQKLAEMADALPAS